jgi:hypothetical protein
MSVTRTGTTLTIAEVNIFTPNGDGKNDYFSGPLYLAQVSSDSVISASVKIYSGSNTVATGFWSGSGQPEGIYNYQADYTTAGGGSAHADGLVRLWRSSSVPCGEKAIYRFPQAYLSNLVYDSLSPYNENLPCN